MNDTTDRPVRTIRTRLAALFALLAGLGMLALLAATPSNAGGATALPSTSRYQGASPTHDWGGYTCAATARPVSATYVKTRSGTNIGSVRLNYSPKCGTYYGQVFRYGPMHKGFWYSAGVFGGDGSHYYCQYTAPSGGTGGGCYTPMLTRVTGRGYLVKGIWFHGNHQISGFGATKYTTSIGTPAASGTVAAVIKAAESQRGHGYIYSWAAGGKDGPSYGTISPSGHDDRRNFGYDCSGLTQYAYWQGAHRDIGTSSSEQVNQGRTVKWADRRPGDLLFWYDKHGNTDHVAIYVGNDELVESSVPRDTNSVHVAKVYGSHPTVQRILG